MKMTENSQKLWKTLWETEKLLVTSNFSFSHSVFKRIVMQTRRNQGLFGKDLNTIYFTEIDRNKFLKHILISFDPTS